MSIFNITKLAIGGWNDKVSSILIHEVIEVMDVYRGFDDVGSRSNS